MLTTPETCRICLGKRHLNRIFHKGRAEKIQYCASVQISEDDDLPKMICNQCIFYLDIAYVFRTVCEATDARLRRFCEEEKKKKEVNYYHINSPFANEIVIGEDEEIQVPMGTLLQERENVNRSDKSPWELPVTLMKKEKATDGNSTFEKSNKFEEVFEDEEILKEPTTKEMLYANKNTETEGEIVKLGRHAARKKLANVQKKIPTVKDKILSMSECHVQIEVPRLRPSKEDLSKFEDKDASGHIIEEKKCDIKNTLRVHHQFDDITPIQQGIENGGQEISDGIFKSKVQAELLETTPTQEEKQNAEVKQVTSKSYQCNICEKSFPYRSHLKRHLSVHSGLKEFKCTKCDKKFVNHYNLAVHKEKHTGKFRHKCADCGQGFPSPSVLRRHMNSHSKSEMFQCRLCFKKLLHRSSLKIHEKMHTCRPSYACEVCLKKFSYRRSLAEHKKTHQDLKGNVCLICGKQFTRKTSLKRHTLAHQPNRGPQALQCDECRENFKTRELLIKHLERHLGINRKL